MISFGLLIPNPRSKLTWISNTKPQPDFCLKKCLSPSNYVDQKSGFIHLCTLSFEHPEGFECHSHCWGQRSPKKICHLGRDHIEESVSWFELKCHLKTCWKNIPPLSLSLVRMSLYLHGCVPPPCGGGTHQQNSSLARGDMPTFR